VRPDRVRPLLQLAFGYRNRAEMERQFSRR
jgi:hypothetical protein